MIDLNNITIIPPKVTWDNMSWGNNIVNIALINNIGEILFNINIHRVDSTITSKYFGNIDEYKEICSTGDYPSEVFDKLINKINKVKI